MRYTPGDKDGIGAGGGGGGSGGGGGGGGWSFKLRCKAMAVLRRALMASPTNCAAFADAESGAAPLLRLINSAAAHGRVAIDGLHMHGAASSSSDTTYIGSAAEVEYDMHAQVSTAVCPQLRFALN